MATQALLLEVILSGFFAIACYRARAKSDAPGTLAPRSLFMLTDRLERLKLSRWQWFSMVLMMVMVRVQQGAPLVVEGTALVMFVLFLALPTARATHARGVSRA